MNDKIIKISNELKKFGVGVDYFASIEGGKKVYDISSEELKSSLRRIIFDAHLWKDAFGGMKMEGRDFRNDYFSYKESVDILPDKFVAVINWEEKLEEIVGDSQKREKETNERMKRQKEQFGYSSQSSWGSGGDGEKHSLHFRKWDSEGTFVEEKIKELDKPLLFSDEDKDDLGNSSKITEMDLDEKDQKEKDKKYYEEIGSEKDLTEEQLRFIQKNESNIKNDSKIFKGELVVVGFGLAFVLTFIGGVVWYKKKPFLRVKGK